MKMKKKDRIEKTQIDLSLDGHKCSKYKTWLSLMMLLCAKQHINNIWSWIHEKGKTHRGCVEKSVAYIQATKLTKVLILNIFIVLF